MHLVIVESPTKAKTIGKYLTGDYKVIPSVGHIRDLPKNNKKAIDIKGGFVPRYEIVKGKEKTVEEIRKLASKADEVILATDPDREGEAIAWHLKEACGLKSPKRIAFHEITDSAIREALAHPRDIDLRLLKAQEARRVLDRLFGYDLSRLIWKKIRYGLSAGRVQSPALRILVERERELQAFIPEPYWVISALFRSAQGNELLLTCEEQPKEEAEAMRIIGIAKTHPWHVGWVKKSETKRSPRPPFITSTLQQAASTRFGFSPSRTMMLAQRLYEQGLISYMRTDSTAISKEALREIYTEVEKRFGKEYLLPRTYVTKSKTAQEAHEAIRPTKIGHLSAGANEDEKRLYTLIWERTIASQMADAKLLRTKITANVGDPSIPPFSANGNITLFPGWLAVNPSAKGEDVELPDIKEGEPLTLITIEEEKKQTEPPPRYTEAGLVRELEKREIGRPSTYATIISTLEKRGYVEKIGKALKPTDTGEVVSKFLEDHFGNYVSDSFTAEMERDLDKIANGERDYVRTLKEFYTPFSKDVKSKDKMEKVTTLGDADPEWKCPVGLEKNEDHGRMIIKLGRIGKFLSCNRFPDCMGMRRIDGSIMETPKETGETCPKCKTGKLMERQGRFGMFIACSNYPKCKYVKQSENNHKGTGIKCPEDGGEIIERRGRFGTFFSCTNYPKCKFIMKSRPTGNVCVFCNSLMMEGTKTIPERCSDKSCPNHQPHKLKK